MAYLSKSNSARHQGIASPWATKLALKVARALTRPYGVNVIEDKFGKQYTADLVSDGREANGIILFEPIIQGVDLVFEDLDVLVGNWRRICRGFVRFTVTRVGLVVTDHDASIRGALAAQAGLDDRRLTGDEIRKLLGGGVKGEPLAALTA